MFTLSRLKLFLPLMLLLGMAGMTPAMAQFASSTLSGTAGSSISGTALTTGGTWVKGSSQSADLIFTAASRARLNAGSTGGNWVVYNVSTTPAQNGYVVQADFYMATAPGNTDQFGTIARSDGTPSNGYFAEFIGNNGTPEVQISKGFNSGVSQALFTPVAGQTYRFAETCVQDATNGAYTDIGLTVQRLSDSQYATSAGGWQAGITNACYYQDTSPYTTIGHPGLWMFGGTATPTDTTSFQVANFAASYPAAPVLTGTLSANAATSTSITPKVSSISGGTAPYSTVFSYSTATNGTYTQIGTAITGANPVASTAATGLSSSTTYYFRATVTDSSGTPIVTTLPSATTGTPLATTAPPVNATAYTASGSPASPVTTGTAITLTYSLTGGTTLSSSLVITPSANLGGSFSSGTLTYSGGTATMPNGTTSGTIVFTPSAAGSLSLSQSHTGGGFSGDPAALAYTVNSGPFTIPVNSPAVHFSPGNWSGDTGRGGSAYRQSWANGAYETWAWTAGSTPSCTLQISNQTSGSQISYSLDGVLTKQVSVPTSGGIAITVTTGSHILTVYNDASAQSARWGLTNSYKVTGLTVDGGATAGTAPSYSAWVLVVGDSITEGINALQGVPDFLSDYSYFAGQALLNAGYDFGLSACGYNGWLKPGDSGGDVPAYYYISGSSGGAGGTYNDSLSRWNKLDATNSLLDSNSHISAYGATGQEPSLIYANLGVNEALGAANLSDEQASIQQALVALRAAAPSAYILVQVPPNLYSTLIYGSTTGYTYITPVKAGVAAYQAAHPADTKTVLVDFGQIGGNTLASFTPNVHPDIFGHAYLGPIVAGAMLKKLQGAAAAIGRGRKIN